MKVTNNNALQFLRRYVITRTDCYARQTKTGSYVKVQKILTDAAIQRHLDHKITIGLYNTGTDGRVKFVLWDIDNHEGKEIVPDGIVKNKARKILTTLKSFDIPYIFAESSPGCYHITVFFDTPVATAEAHDFGRWIARNAEMYDIECFPKQRAVPKGEYGNLIRAAFGLHQKKGTEYRYLNDNFEYVDEFEVIPIDISGFVAKDAYNPPANTEDGTGEPMPPLRTTATNGGVPPCLQACLENNVQMTGGGGHYVRISITCAYRDIGLKFPALCQLFSNQDDYDPIETAKQVKSVLKKDGGYSYSCRTLREKCQRFVLPYCDNCPRGRRFK